MHFLACKIFPAWYFSLCWHTHTSILRNLLVLQHAPTVSLDECVIHELLFVFFHGTVFNSWFLSLNLFCDIEHFNSKCLVILPQMVLPFISRFIVLVLSWSKIYHLTSKPGYSMNFLATKSFLLLHPLIPVQPQLSCG